MAFWLRIASRIDRTNERIGRLVYWLTLLMVLVGAYNALVRYLDRYTGLGLSSNTYIELQWYMYSIVFLLGAAYTLKHNAHVRVDVLFVRLSPRGRAWINLLGTILFLIPFCVLILWTSWPAVRNSWVVGEMSPDPGGLPRYPIKAVVPVAFFLLMLQAVSLAIKQVGVLRGDVHDDEFAGIGAGSDVQGDVGAPAGPSATSGEGRGKLSGDKPSGDKPSGSRLSGDEEWGVDRGDEESGVDRGDVESGDDPSGDPPSDGGDSAGPTSGLADDESDDGIPGGGI